MARLRTRKTEAEKREARREYMRVYMQSYKPQRKTERAQLTTHDRPFAVVTAEAAYLPGRDEPLQWASPYGQAMGEPPIGRRAIDK